MGEATVTLLTVEHVRLYPMRLVMLEGDQTVETMMDFVVPTMHQALAYIRDGAINGVELLDEAGLTTAEAELARMNAS
jgi:hypothetical protein